MCWVFFLYFIYLVTYHSTSSQAQRLQWKLPCFQKSLESKVESPSPTFLTQRDHKGGLCSTYLERASHLKLLVCPPDDQWEDNLSRAFLRSSSVWFDLSLVTWAMPSQYEERQQIEVRYLLEWNSHFKKKFRSI